MWRVDEWHIQNKLLTYHECDIYACCDIYNVTYRRVTYIYRISSSHTMNVTYMHAVTYTMWHIDLWHIHNHIVSYTHVWSSFSSWPRLGLHYSRYSTWTAGLCSALSLSLTRLQKRKHWLLLRLWGMRGVIIMVWLASEGKNCNGCSSNGPALAGGDTWLNKGAVAWQRFFLKGRAVGEVRIGRGCWGGGIACAMRRDVGLRGDTRVEG